jgi:hypothetical protein
VKIETPGLPTSGEKSLIVSPAIVAGGVQLQSPRARLDSLPFLSRPSLLADAPSMYPRSAWPGFRKLAANDGRGFRIHSERRASIGSTFIARSAGI